MPVHNSSKISQSPELRVALSEDDFTEKTASSTSNVNNSRVSETATTSFESSGSVANVKTSQACTNSMLSSRVSLSNILDFFHVENFSNASDEEFMYFGSLYCKVLFGAKSLARESGSSCDRAHQAIMASIAKFCEQK